MGNPFVHISDLSKQLPEAPKDSVISQTLVKNDVLDVSLFKFAAGQELTEHASPYPAIIHILQGEGSIMLGDKPVKLNTGAWVYMEPNLPHSLKTTSPMVLLLTLRK